MRHFIASLTLVLSIIVEMLTSFLLNRKLQYMVPLPSKQCTKINVQTINNSVQNEHKNIIIISQSTTHMHEITISVKFLCLTSDVLVKRINLNVNYTTKLNKKQSGKIW